METVVGNGDLPRSAPRADPAGTAGRSRSARRSTASGRRVDVARSYARRTSARWPLGPRAAGALARGHHRGDLGETGRAWLYVELGRPVDRRDPARDLRRRLARGQVRRVLDPQRDAPWSLPRTRSRPTKVLGVRERSAAPRAHRGGGYPRASRPYRDPMLVSPRARPRTEGRAIDEGRRRPVRLGCSRSGGPDDVALLSYTSGNHRHRQGGDDQPPANLLAMGRGGDRGRSDARGRRESSRFLPFAWGGGSSSISVADGAPRGRHR